MAQRRSRITNRQLVGILILSVLLSYSVPTIFGMKSPRLTPKDQMTPLQLKELEAEALRSEIALLEDRVALLTARNALAEKAQILALEKSQEAQDAFAQAEADALDANRAFDAADLKEKEAQQALRYARMTEKQAREALRVATAKEKTAQLALSTANILQQEANKALNNAQTQSKLASQTLAEIEALEQKIAELNSNLTEKPDAKTADIKPQDDSKDEAQTRRLPKAGKVVVAFEDGLVPTHDKLSIPRDFPDLTVTERKERFITLLLPLIIKANDIIKARRVRLMAAIETNDQTLIARYAKLYGLSKFEGSDEALHEMLLSRVAPIPTSLALAQAAVESGWGQSRFAQEGNALYGQWAWSADAGIKPLNASNSRAVIRSFATIYDSVFAYMHNLNTHRAYQDFRDERAAHIAKGEAPSGLRLARYLTAYAETGEKYVYSLQAMILHNRFDIYDGYKLAL